MKSLLNLKKSLITVLLIPLVITVQAQTFNPTYSLNASGSVNNFAGGYTFAYATTGAPWNGALMSFGGFGNNYDCQISTDYGPNGGNHLSFRTRNGDAAIWNSWYELYHSGNFNNANTDFNARNIIANGNVGVGTTTPTTTVYIQNAATNYSSTLTLKNTVNNVASRAGITMENDGGNQTIFYKQSSGNADANDVILYSVQGDTRIYTNGAERMRIANSGNVGIGTAAPDAKLAVNGTIHSREVKVDLSVPGPDYVFDTDYKLTELHELKAYVEKHHHLPEIPSAEEMARNGLNLGEMNTKLLKKVEELTLYLIEMKSEINELKKKTSR
jgi:hypothetical protein